MVISDLKKCKKGHYLIANKNYSHIDKDNILQYQIEKNKRYLVTYIKDKYSDMVDYLDEDELLEELQEMNDNEIDDLKNSYTICLSIGDNEHKFEVLYNNIIFLSVFDLLQNRNN